MYIYLSIMKHHYPDIILRKGHLQFLVFMLLKHSPKSNHIIVTAGHTGTNFYKGGYKAAVERCEKGGTLFC
jgi:hypothetical protein